MLRLSSALFVTSNARWRSLMVFMMGLFGKLHPFWPTAALPWSNISVLYRPDVRQWSGYEDNHDLFARNNSHSLDIGYFNLDIYKSIGFDST